MSGDTIAVNYETNTVEVKTVGVAGAPGLRTPVDFNAANAYVIYDTVYYLGSTYAAKTAISAGTYPAVDGNNMPVASAYWQPVASRGDTGDTGDTGAVGDNLNPRGTYSAGTAYVALDTIVYNGLGYYIPAGTPGSITGTAPPASPWVARPEAQAALDAAAAAIAAQATVEYEADRQVRNLSAKYVVSCANDNLDITDWNAEGYGIDGFYRDTGERIAGSMGSPIALKYRTPRVDNDDFYIDLGYNGTRYVLTKTDKISGEITVINESGNAQAPFVTADGTTLYYSGDADGYWEPWSYTIATEVTRKVYSRKEWSNMGDSLTQQGHPTYFWAAFNMSGLNRGWSAQNIDQIFTRLGVYQCTVTLTGNQIPATTTPVIVTAHSKQVLYRSAQFNDTLPVTINGVPGTIATIIGTVTITIASPGVVTWTAHGFPNGTQITMNSTGTLPTPLAKGQIYYVVNATTDTFQLSLTNGGAAINTSGTQSGVHTLYADIWTFTRTTAGSVVAVSPGTVISFDQGAYDIYNALSILAGVNDVSEGINADPSAVGSRLVAAWTALKAMIPVERPTLVAHSVINRASFPSGSTNYNYIIAANALLAAWCALNGVHYFDGRSRMASLDALDRAGMIREVTISIASPGVISRAAHGYTNGEQLTFTDTTGALPTGLSLLTPYYIVNATTNDFQLSLTLGGAAINTSGTQSGIHRLCRSGNLTDIANDVCPRDLRGVPGDYDDIHWYPVGRVVYGEYLAEFCEERNIKLPWGVYY